METNQKSIEKLQESIRDFLKLFGEAFENFIKWAKEHWNFIKENWSKFYHFEEEKAVQKTVRYRKELTHQKMQHQVIDRKPRHAVRKIIN